MTATTFEHPLLEIIAQQRLVTLFQPIIACGNTQIIGYEALLQGPAGSPLQQPIALFDAARQIACTEVLERVGLELAIRRFAIHERPQKLFLNIAPSSLLHAEINEQQLLSFLKQTGLGPNRIVLEIAEHLPIEDHPLSYRDYSTIRQILTRFHALGFELALDSLGSSRYDLRLWGELLPKYVKIGAPFIRDLANDPIALSFVRSMQTMARAMNSQVIAEGVDTVMTYQIIERLGIACVQGEYLGPAALEPSLFPLPHLTSATIGDKERGVSLMSSRQVRHIVKRLAPIPPEMLINDVFERFKNDEESMLLPVVDGHRPVGLIYRNRFFARLFSSRYGQELYGKKPIQFFLDGFEPLVVESEVSIEEVSRKLTTNTRYDQAFIVTEQGRYLGYGTVLDLLEEITQQQIQSAQHANPLTLLPGIVPINQTINKLLETQQMFAVGYFDLDNFKPYNDIYGYHAGDEVIKTLASLLKTHISETHGHVGHIGGDDFIAVILAEDWLARCQAILDDFKELAPSFYNEEHRQLGGIRSFNRQGEEMFFSLLSVSAGLVAPESVRYCRSHVDIADLASDAKHQAKLIAGNSLFVNRRNAPKVSPTHSP